MLCLWIGGDVYRACEARQLQERRGKWSDEAVRTRETDKL